MNTWFVSRDLNPSWSGTSLFNVHKKRTDIIEMSAHLYVHTKWFVIRFNVIRPANNRVGVWARWEAGSLFFQTCILNLKHLTMDTLTRQHILFYILLILFFFYYLKAFQTFEMPLSNIISLLYIPFLNRQRNEFLFQLLYSHFVDRMLLTLLQ